MPVSAAGARLRRRLSTSFHRHKAGSGFLLRRPSRREESLPAVVLFLQRTDAAFELPDDDFELRPGDQLLFAGREGAREEQQAVLRNEKLRDYLLTGQDPPSSWLWRWLKTRRSTRPPAARAP